VNYVIRKAEEPPPGEPIPENINREMLRQVNPPGEFVFNEPKSCPAESPHAPGAGVEGTVRYNESEIFRKAGYSEKILKNCGIDTGLPNRDYKWTGKSPEQNNSVFGSFEIDLSNFKNNMTDVKKTLDEITLKKLNIDPVMIWESAPKKAEWLGIDSDGTGVFYKEKPKTSLHHNWFFCDSFICQSLQTPPLTDWHQNPEKYLFQRPRG
jgi:hypothetical protein